MHYYKETLSAIGGQVLNKHPILRQLKVIYLPQVGFKITSVYNIYFQPFVID